MKLLLIIISILYSCSPPDTIIPSCDYIEATRSGTHVRMKIHSDSESIVMIRDYGRSFTIQKRFYNCISISAEPGEEVVIEDKGSKCTIIID